MLLPIFIIYPQVFRDEIFGEVAEEKDVEGIKSKVFEARSSKSYDSYEFIAKYIRPESLMTMMSPLKQVGFKISSELRQHTAHPVS